MTQLSLGSSDTPTPPSLFGDGGEEGVEEAGRQGALPQPPPVSTPLATALKQTPLCNPL